MQYKEFWKKWMPRDWLFDELDLKTQQEFIDDLRMASITILSPEAAKNFIDALENPPEPNEALKRAWENYKKLVEPSN